MNSYLSKPNTFIEVPITFCNSSKTLLIKFSHSFSRNKSCKNACEPKSNFIKRKNLTINASNASTSSSLPDSVVASTNAEEEDAESIQLFEKLKDAERQKINKLEELERKADLQLERQLFMASCWGKALLTLRGMLKGTECDPSHNLVTLWDFFTQIMSNLCSIQIMV